MKNSASLKGKIKNLAKNNNVDAQSVLQNYMLERLLERIAVSKFKNNFVIKGGFLISSIIGVGSRTTMDLDVTLKNFPLEESIITETLNEIIGLDMSDEIIFKFNHQNTSPEAPSFSYGEEGGAHSFPKNIFILLIKSFNACIILSVRR